MAQHKLLQWSNPTAVKSPTHCIHCLVNPRRLQCQWHQGTVRCGSWAPHKTQQFRFFTLLFFQAIPGFISRTTKKRGVMGVMLSSWDQDIPEVRNHLGSWHKRIKPCVFFRDLTGINSIQFLYLSKVAQQLDQTSKSSLIIRCWSSILSVSTWHDVAWSFDDLIWR